jgi:hypothetical protein
MLGLALPASGGAVAGGTATNPIRTDTTGTTTQPVSAVSLPLPSGAATEATLANVATSANQSTLNTRVGDVTETAPATDTASSGLNGRLQRIAQRITSLIALIPSALTGSGNFKVAVVESTASQTVSGTVTANLGTIAGVATEATLANVATSANQSTLNTRIGDVTETAPSTDTASSGLNGRLQRTAQRLTSLIALVPSALTGSGNFKVAVVESTATQTVSGTVTSNLGTIAGVATETTLAALNTKVATDVTADYDTGAGTQSIPLAGLALPASGGAVAGGTATNPFRTDPTGTTIQPVSGTVTATQGTAAAAGSGWLVEFDRPTTANLTSASINASLNGDNTLVVGSTSQTVRVFKLFLVANAAVNIKFKSGASTDLTAVMNLNAGGSVTLDFDGEPYFITASGAGFFLNLSSAQQVSGRVYYIKS